MTTAKLHIGCSGYYYAGWKGTFYPKELKPREWLPYYSSVFDTVELNGTFYRLPKLADLKKYYEQTGAHFRFSVKMSRYVSHIRRLRDCADEIANFHGLVEEGLGDKLACVLYQMPPSFAYSEEQLETVLNALPEGKHTVIEFRNASWWNDEVYKALAAAGITMCNIDFPGLQVPIVPTQPVFYMRMHGNPVLFKSSYSTEDLQQLALQIPKRAKQVHVYFNNTYFESGYTNALELKGMMEG